MTQAAPVSNGYGVNSEVGRLRKVLVCAPGLAHSRLTPSNCDELLFDDVLWVQNAKRDHFDFMSKMRDRGVEVVELHEVLAEAMESPEARSWLLAAISRPSPRAPPVTTATVPSRSSNTGVSLSCGRRARTGRDG